MQEGARFRILGADDLGIPGGEKVNDRRVRFGGLGKHQRVDGQPVKDFAQLSAPFVIPVPDQLGIKPGDEGGIRSVSRRGQSLHGHLGGVFVAERFHASSSRPSWRVFACVGLPFSSRPRTV